MARYLIPCIWLAGGLQLLVASANFFAKRMLRYRENLANVSPIVREIFVVQNAYIVLIQVGFAAMCFAFAAELAAGRPLARYLCAFLAVFWGLRLPIQLFYYDRELKRRHPVFNAMFLAAFAYLASVFAWAALRPAA